MEPTDIQSRLAELYRRSVHGIKLGLATMEGLCEALGNPHRAFAVIHVAGTNGKGSTAAMIESILRAAGIKTGLYTSPHLIRFNERICVDGEMISDDALAAVMDLVAEADKVSMANSGDREASFFEFSTAMAFACFAEARVQVAVVETGLGGRLDATNVVTPLLSVITSIGKDHTDWLGDSIDVIAMEKGGIVKPERPVLVGRLEDEAMAVIQQISEERQARFVKVEDVVSAQRQATGDAVQKIKFDSMVHALPPVTISLPGQHQLENACTALAAIELFEELARVSLPNEVIRDGLESTVWRGRFEKLSDDPALFVDAAHNPHGAKALAAQLKTHSKRKPVGLLVGFSSEKDAAGILHELKGSAQVVWGVLLDHERGMEEGVLNTAFKAVSIRPQAIGGLEEILKQAKAWAAEEGGMLCIAGSVYLAGEAITLIDDAAGH